jgi:hypothetical protein
VKHPPILAVAAILAVLAGAVGFALFWPAPTAEPSEPLNASPANTTPAAPAQVPVPAVAADPHQSHEREDVPVQADAGADLPQGVRGVVVGPDGKGLPGLRVFLIENVAGNNPFLQWTAMQHGVPMLPAAQTTTDPHGAFALGLKKPADKQYDVRVLADQYADAAMGPLQIRPGDWYDAGEIQLKQGLVVRGRVTIAGTDYPAPQATVSLMNPNAFEEMARASLPGREQGLRVTADAAGWYELRNAPTAGPWTLQAVAPGFAKVVRSPVDPAPEQAATVVDFELPRGLSIQGRVLATSGRPLPDARIQAMALQSDGTKLEAFSDQNGNFEVLGMREGSQWLRITAKGYQMRDERSVTAGTQGLQVILEETGAARARVRDPDGRVLDRYVLGVRRWFPQGGGQIGLVPSVPDVSVRAEDLVDGAATMTGMEPGTDQERAEYVFQVQADGFARTLSHQFDISAGGPPMIEITVTRGAILLGQVVDEQGRPVEGAEVLTQGDGSEDGPLRGLLAGFAPDKITRAKARTDAQGNFRLERLAFAEYRVKVQHPDYCDGIVQGLQLATATEQRLPSITLARGTQVRGTASVDGVRQGQVKVVVDVDPAGGDAGFLHAETVSNHDGTFVIPKRLPPGNYEIKAAQLAADAAHPDIFKQILQMKQTTTSLELRRGQDIAEHSLNITTR